MNAPMQITFRNMPPSEAIENMVREKAAKLDSFCDRITSCRVTIEVPHRHRHKGKAYDVRIDLALPGAEIIVNRTPQKPLETASMNDAEHSDRELVESHEPSKHAAHEDLYVAVRDAFSAAGRRLQDYVRRQRQT